jgi:hypothetical protein
MPFISADGTIVEAELTNVCILYDPTDGNVIHRHEVVTFPGGMKDEADKVEATAYRVAAQLGHDISRLKALHVAPGTYVSHMDYAVDTKAVRLVVRAESPFMQSSTS